MDAISSTTYTRSKIIEEYAGPEEIVTEMENLAHENFILSQTAEVLERYLRKRSPAMLVGMEKFIDMSHSTRGSVQTGRSSSVCSSKSNPSPMSPGSTPVRSSTTSEMRGMVSRSNAQSSLASCKISPAAKADMVERELEDSRMTMGKLKKKFESAKFLLQTEEENMRIDIEYLEESKIKLEDVLAQNTDNKSGKVFHDKFFRFLEHELQIGDRYLRKIKLKTKSLQTEYKRILAQQQQRMELIERLHPIDIEKLLIENDEQLDILELKNQKLQDLKKVVGRKGQTLVSVKSKLNDTIISLKNLKQNSKQNATKCKYTEEQEVQNQNQLRTANRINLDIRKLNAAFKSPDVHSYLRIQSKLEEQNSEEKTWERRCKYQDQQIALLEHQIKQLSSVSRPQACTRKERSFTGAMLPFDPTSEF